MCRVVGRSNNNANASGGLVYASASTHHRTRTRFTALGSPTEQNTTTNFNRTNSTASRDDAQLRARKPNRSNSDAHASES